jgi:hypothetical protein
VVEFTPNVSIIVVSTNISSNAELITGLLPDQPLSKKVIIIKTNIHKVIIKNALIPLSSTVKILPHFRQNNASCGF